MTGSIRASFVFFLIIFHNGFALHYKYDPRWKWKENQFVDLNQEYYKHQSEDTESFSDTSTTPASTYPPVVQGTSEGTDEDLLDLMVRIAETPSEWEKIHQVLNQLGKSKLKSNSSHDLKKLSEKVWPISLTARNPTTSTQKPTYKLDSQTNEKSTSPKAPRNNVISKDEPNDSLKLTDPKPAWPDIFKNEYEKLFWNADNVYEEEMSDEDDEDEENYFSQYQWDEEDKSVNNNQKNVNNFNRIPTAASKAHVNRKGSRNTNRKPSSVNSTVHSASDLNSVNNAVHNEKYDFVHFLNSLATTVRPAVANSSRDNNTARGDNWPNFSYHRVTVNPNKEKYKNISKAFIVVSEISPKTNATMTQANADDIEVHQDRSEGDVTQPAVDATEAVSLKKKSHDRKNSKAKVFRHHWRDKQKSHTKRRHHRTHHPEPPPLNN